MTTKSVALPLCQGEPLPTGYSTSHVSTKA
jgi:hypothetical protein